MSAVTATRSELLARKSREGIAQRGHTLLTQKRAALVAELRRVGLEVGDKRAQLERLAAVARRALAQAVAVDGPQGEQRRDMTATPTSRGTCSAGFPATS